MSDYLEYLKAEYVALEEEVKAILYYGNYSTKNKHAWDIVIQLCKENNSSAEVIKQFQQLKEAACG